MELYLLRHADAVEQAATDRERRLSEKGEAQAARCAKFCERHGIVPELILTSPYPRAQQTAAAVAERLGSELVEAKFLESGMAPALALEELGGYRRLTRLMIVGHEPDFSELIAQLLGVASSEALYIRKASLTCIIIRALRPGGGVLQWSVRAKFMS